MSGSIRLIDVANRTHALDVGCNRCKNWVRLSTALLLAEHEPEMPELLRLISANCPNTAALSLYDRCGVYFPGLAALFGVRPDE